MLKGLKNLGDMGKLMAQAQEMQSKAQALQDELETIEVTGESGAGMVQAVVNAKGALRRIKIDPSMAASDAEEIEVLEDLVVAAVNDAQLRAQEEAQRHMAKLTEGMPLPPGMKMPF